MKKIIYTCDRCRQEIEGNPVRIYTESVDRETDDFLYEEVNPELKALDFCKGCSDFFVGLIKRHCSKGAPATVNRDFEKAVQEMTETAEEAGPPPRWKRRAGESWTRGRSRHCATQSGR